MTGYTNWRDVRSDFVERAGGEEAVAAGKEAMLAEVRGYRLAEIRHNRGLTQQEVADRMGVTKGRVSQIEQGKLAGQEVLARYAAALGGRLHQSIYFDDGGKQGGITMTDSAKSARRARHDAIRAQVADEENEAAEAEVAENAAALDVALHLRISRSLDAELRRQAAAEHIPTSALVRRLLTQAVHRHDSGGLTSTEVEEIARRIAREELQRG